MDADRLKIRYPADGADGQPKFLPPDVIPTEYRTEKYLTRPTKRILRQGGY